MEEVRRAIDSAVGATRFSGPSLSSALLPVLSASSELSSALSKIFGELGDPTGKYTVRGLIRAVFLIEPVNDAVTSTKFEARWSSRLVSDPRGCSFDGCWEIFLGLLEELADGVSEEQDLFDRFRRFRSLAYEVPIDYDNRSSGHQPGNVIWVWDPEVEHTLQLREQSTDSGVVGDEQEAFVLARKKTAVKTYLTDRAQTGAHKTNREKRWEAHPSSVHFAFRRDCLKIEHKLLSQICHFEGFPEAVRRQLLTERAVLDLETPARCPITLDPLAYEKLVSSLKAPVWGQSSFQVGHLNPLKGPGSGPEFGHTPDNVAWITADGNRIQGHLSYDETLELLSRIARNYEDVGQSL